jgi:hypothetical protein
VDILVLIELHPVLVIVILVDGWSVEVASNRVNNEEEKGQAQQDKDNYQNGF